MTSTSPVGPLWAAYAGSAVGQEITLHRSRLEALEACVDALGIDLEARYDEEDLEEALTDYCSEGADDWHVCEVEAP